MDREAETFLKKPQPNRSSTLLCTCSSKKTREEHPISEQKATFDTLYTNNTRGY